MLHPCSLLLLIGSRLILVDAFSSGPCVPESEYYTLVTQGTCESEGYASIFDMAQCTRALQMKQFGDALFEVDVVNGIEKPPGCSVALGPFAAVFGNRAYLNTDRDSEREYAPVGLCSEDTPCYCKPKSVRVCEPKPTLAYKVVESGTCRSNGYEDFLDMSECVQVLSENFYNGVPFGMHPVEGTVEPPGCWPLTIGFLKAFTASSRAVGPEACISRDQTEPRTEPFGYCSAEIPCYCKV